MVGCVSSFVPFWSFLGRRSSVEKKVPVADVYEVVLQIVVAHVLVCASMCVCVCGCVCGCVVG